MTKNMVRSIKHTKTPKRQLCGNAKSVKYLNRGWMKKQMVIIEPIFMKQIFKTSIKVLHFEKYLLPPYLFGTLVQANGVIYCDIRVKIP